MNPLGLCTLPALLIDAKGEFVIPARGGRGRAIYFEIPQRLSHAASP